MRDLLAASAPIAAFARAGRAGARAVGWRAAGTASREASCTCRGRTRSRHRARAAPVLEAEPEVAPLADIEPSRTPMGMPPERPAAFDRLMAAVAVPPGREPTVAPERAEMARVDAELLNQLLNQAGEVSIARARVEQQLGSVEFNLAELSRTVTRLKEQLHKLEIETETQILHRHETESGPRTEFDPLELDRYSSIQQFSRALAETASDVASIQALLESLTQETQNQLQLQGRTITELQNGLMRTRMVSFQRHVQRLSRIVRQAASRHRQAGRAGGGGRLRRTGSPGAGAHAAAVRAPAAQCRGARHRDARTAAGRRQARGRTDPPDAAPRGRRGHRRRHATTAPA